VPFLSVLRYLRLTVYFCLGFGPLGLVASATGSGLMMSLVWAVPGGVASSLIARAFFRFQQKDVDSSVKDGDILFERATVIVPISGGGMGKVRIQIAQSVEERYAQAESPDQSFGRDEEVFVARVTEDCVFVRHPDGQQGPDAADTGS